MSTITYIVKVASSKFTIDDAVAPKLTFRDGDTYVFDQADSSNSGHLFSFSTASPGHGSTGYTTGVTTNGTYGQAGANTTIVTSGSTLDTLYYYSSGGENYGSEFSNSGFTTTSEGILKPIVGAEATAEKWGPMVNHAIDQIVDKTVPKSGGTFTGDVTFQGTTTTIDTELQSVDKLEVGANSSDYGAQINQTGTGNILQLQDSGTDVLVVKDGGNVGMGTASPNVISGATNTHVDIRSDNSNYAFLQIGVTGTKTSSDVGYLEFMNGNNNRMASISGGCDGANNDGYLSFATLDH